MVTIFQNIMRPRLRPRLHHSDVRPRILAVSDELTVLRRRNEDQALTIVGLQKAMREVRLEIDELKQAHLKELLRYSKKPKLL